MMLVDVARTEIMQRFKGAGNVVGEKPHLRDWSEILVIAAAIYSLRAAIIQRKKNVKTLKNANLWVFGALVVAEFRIRQLWITRTLDDEANRFKGSNEALRREIQDLTAQNTSLSDEMVPLKKQVTALGEEEVRLRQDILRMQTAESRQGEELEGFKKVVSGLNRGEGAVDSDIESLQAYVAHLQGEEKRLDEVGEKVEAELQELVAGKAASLKRETALNLREEELQRREEALD
jgi:peptidoglycan hydrolase CwlO-like protein